MKNIKGFIFAVLCPTAESSWCCCRHFMYELSILTLNAYNDTFQRKNSMSQQNNIFYDNRGWFWLYYTLFASFSFIKKRIFIIFFLKEVKDSQFEYYACMRELNEFIDFLTFSLLYHCYYHYYLLSFLKGKRERDEIGIFHNNQQNKVSLKPLWGKYDMDFPFLLFWYQ